MENTQLFSISEMREMISLSRDKEKLMLMRNTIKTARKTIRENPDANWENFITANSQIQGLKEYGLTILKNDYDIYQERVSCSKFWQGKVEQDKNDAREEVKSQLKIPDGVNFSIKCATETIILETDDNGMLLLYNQTEPEIQLSDPERGPVGMYSQYFYLTDTASRRIPVVIVNKKVGGERTILHESEHAFFYDYFARNKFAERQGFLPAPPQEKFTLPNNISYSEACNKLHEELIRRISLYRLTSYSEYISDASTSVLKEPYRFQWLADDYIPYLPFATEKSNLYAENIDQTIIRLKNAIEESPLTEQEKIKALWQVEVQVAEFNAENQIIGGWIKELWEKTGENEEDFICTLLSIPLERIWSIGFFLDKNPEELKTQLQRHEGYEKYIQDQAKWHLFVTEAMTDRDLIEERAREAHARGEKHFKEAFRDDAVQIIKDDAVATYYAFADAVEKIYFPVSREMRVSLRQKLEAYAAKLKGAGVFFNEDNEIVKRLVELVIKENFGFAKIHRAFAKATGIEKPLATIQLLSGMYHGDGNTKGIEEDERKRVQEFWRKTL